MKPNLFDDLYEIEDEKNIDDELIDGHYPLLIMLRITSLVAI